MTDIVAVKGDTESYALTIVDSEGDAIDLGGADLWFTVKLNSSDPDAQALILKTVGDGIVVGTPSSDGEATVAIDPEDTERFLVRDYYYDVQMKAPGGTVTTVVSGLFTVQADVTRSTD